MCTSGDSCNAGACEIGPNTCQCVQDSDCGKYDDGNLCNGVLYCDKSEPPFLCKPNPATVVKCPVDADTACSKNQCVPKTGQCATSTLQDGSPCDDANLCSIADVCKAGTCAGSNMCACLQDADCAPFDDGDLCNGAMVCDSKVLPHICKPTNVAVSCPKSAVACQKSVCVPKTGLCVGASDLSQDGTPCDDSDTCTINTVCTAGSCGGGLSKNCDDGDGCTLDSCAGAVCSHLPQAATNCDDANECTSGDKCDAAGNCAGKPISCDDGNVCTKDACANKTGCLFTDNTDPCNDGDLCTALDTCKGGKCIGSTKACSDGNPCTADQCNASTGQCAFEPAPGECSDGNLCTVSDTCGGGQCAGIALTCNDNLPCTADACLPASGCKFSGLPTGATCSDGNPCTTGDACTKGSCVGVVGCDDSNACTADGCGGGGCTHTPIPVPSCDDGNSCTDADKCSNGLCAGTPISCPGNCDGLSLCNPELGCPVANGFCDDGNVCTTDSCVDGIGCAGTPAPDGQTCGTAPNGGFCQAGLCSNCKSIRIFVPMPAGDVSLNAVVGVAGDFFAAGSVQNGTAQTDGLLVRVTSNGVLSPPLAVGGGTNRVFWGIASADADSMVAVGSLQSLQTGQGLDGWVYGINVNGTVEFNKTHGQGGDDAFYGIIARQGNPIAFGYQGNKGWIAEVKPDGSLGSDKTQALSGYVIRWRAAAATAPGSSVLFLTGLAISTTTGAPSAVVASVDAASLTTNWIKTTAGAGEQFFGAVPLGSGVVAAGVKISGSTSAGWLNAYDAVGTSVSSNTDVSKGSRGYLAATLLGTDIVAVGGAEKVGASASALTSFAWFAHWNAAGSTIQKTNAIATMKGQIWHAVVPMGTNLVAVGDVQPPAGSRVGWIAALNSDGRYVCAP